jgi:hypothetical protein
MSNDDLLRQFIERSIAATERQAAATERLCELIAELVAINNALLESLIDDQDAEGAGIGFLDGTTLDS